MSRQDRLYKELSKDDPRNLCYKGHYKVGKEYTIKGMKYKPKEPVHYEQIGIASWYGGKDRFHGKVTANGDSYNKHALTAAHLTLPMPSLVKVTNLNNDKSLILMVNDRGPFAKGRILDVSEEAAKLLAFKKQGSAKVHVRYLHTETQEFLKQIALQQKSGARVAAKPKLSKHCSVNCQVKLVNIKHKLVSTP